MPAARRQELTIGFGKGKQTDIATANVLANIWRLNNLSGEFADPILNVETDADEFGKSHEFATQTFQTSWDVGGTIDKYLTSEFAAWMSAFGLGKVVKTGVGPFTYTCTPLPTSTDGIELPYFSYLEAIRQGGSAVIDRMAVGCAVNSWRVAINSGPGRQNSRATVQFVGSGKLTDPSAITIPAATAETLLPASGLALTINGVNYVSNKNIVSLEFGMDNNLQLDAGFFPGSGFQTPGVATSGAIRGRIEIGTRVPVFSFSARFENGSTEVTKLKAQTAGTASIALTADANNSLTVTFHDLTFQVAQLGDVNGLVVVNVTVAPRYHSANGLVTAVAVTGTDGIAQ